MQTALGRVDLVPAGGSVTLDARDLSFIDHRGLIQLVEHVRGRGASTALQVGPSSAVPMLAGLLRLPDLEMVVS